ncbi:MAG: acylneuraminate cytidylyltransferase family protein [Planctomycetota bacterium]|nr:acylneuraminate cytidylyltransferase family protein [Planctomycetota bacterium]
MNVLGVILAREGSVGLRGKHLRSLCGHSVIQYTFDHARASELLTSVVVSTDCPQIKKHAASNGFRVIDRPPELATSSASVQDAMLHAMENAEAADRSKADALVVLYGNVPLRPPGVIDRAIDLLDQTKCDSVRSFCPVGKWHPAWMSRLIGDRVEAVTPGSIHRRQDLTPMFFHEGAVVAVSRASMLRGRANPEDPHAFFGVDRRGIRTEIGQTVEIDETRDLFLAEAILRERASHQSESSNICQTRVA